MNYRAVMIAVLACTSCSRDRSPLDLWDMRAGMPLQQLDSIAVHDQRERFTCRTSVGSFQECWLSTKGAFGRVVAIVDSTQRVISIAFRPDLPSMSGSSTGSGLLIETELLRRRWNRTAPVTTDNSKPPTRVERWVTKDRRWSGHIVWVGSAYPSEIAVADVNAERKFMDLVYIAQADSIMRAARMDPAVLTVGRRGDAQLQVVMQELKRLSDVQDLIYQRKKTYAQTLANAHFIPAPDVDLLIRSAGPSGWWAVGTHSGVPGQQCVIWVGASPAPPKPDEWRLGGEPRTAECGATAP